jgi:hypothetical protein
MNAVSFSNKEKLTRCYKLSAGLIKSNQQSKEISSLIQAESLGRLGGKLQGKTGFLSVDLFWIVKAIWPDSISLPPIILSV